jgi:4-diphosphocytidyl-2-C-methyl-D-erythritol kinase
MRGIGEILQPVAGLEEIPVVLVNPRVHCPTAQVFAFYDGDFATAQEMAGLPMRFIAGQGNDLTVPATAVVPEIAAVIAALTAQEGAMFARLSGSGATCFGVFDSEAQAQGAADAIRAAHPGWWVVPAVLNRVARY